MFLVVRRGAVTTVAGAGELAGAAAVACVRAFADDPALAAWRERPGKVTLRARGRQWDEALATLPHVLAGDAVAAIPPRRRSERGPVLERMQAMTTALEPPPEDEDGDDPVAGRVTYLLNPALEMSSGKTIAQIAHAAVMAADTGALEDWVAAGCPARVARPDGAAFARWCRDSALAALVVDAGLTEVPPGTVTVLALPPAA
jgi:peptidyl-tRNA hydrolase